MQIISFQGAKPQKKLDQAKPNATQSMNHTSHASNVQARKPLTADVFTPKNKK